MTIPEVPPGRLVMLVEGASFCLSGPDGDIDPGRTGTAGGLFVADRRLLSTFVLRVNGQVPQVVDHHLADPAAAVFVTRARAAATSARSAARSTSIST